MGINGVKSIEEKVQNFEIDYDSSVSVKYKVYAERWIILMTVITITCSNMTQWVAYSALVDQTNMFYCGPENIENCNASFLSNQIFQIVAVIVALVGMYSATVFGILPTLRISALCNITGSTIRLIASIPLIHSFPLRQVLMLSGTFISATSQMYFVVFSKVAESWFFPQHRASATVACSNSTVLGVVLGTFLASLIIPSGSLEDISFSWHFFTLNSIIFVLCLIALISSFSVADSVPETPPSASSEHEIGLTVSSGVVLCLKNYQFIVQMVVYAVNFSIINGIIFVSDILNYQGYNLKGYPIAISTTICMFVAYFIGIVADRTKKLKEITTIIICIMAVDCLAIRLYLLKPYSNWYDSVIICVLLSIAMSCSASQLPIGNEMGVETTFPVHESVSTGLLNTIGQAWIFSFYFILYALKDTDIIYTTNPNENWKVSLDFWVFISFLNAAVAMFFLNPKYNRMKLENNEK